MEETAIKTISIIIASLLGLAVLVAFAHAQWGLYRQERRQQKRFDEEMRKHDEELLRKHDEELLRKYDEELRRKSIQPIKQQLNQTHYETKD